MQIVNFKSYGSVKALYKAFGGRWVYIGRPNPFYALPGSPLANPFKITPNYSRESSLKDYSNYLWSKINAADPGILFALGKLSANSVLVCWCAPLPCHGQIVASAWEWLNSRGK